MNINWSKYGIDISKQVGGKMICPRCSPQRKNKRDRSLSVDIKTGAFNCHYNGCDFRGYAVDIQKEKKQYVKPPARLEKLSKKSIDWFEGRGISNNTLLRFGITESKEWMPQFEKEVTCICFNYSRNEELVNIKFRGPQKSFKMAKDAELIFYNLDAVKGEEEIVIVEGEIDCLTFHECGIYNVVSVPNGASMGNQKLEYLDNCWEVFEQAKRIVLAVDNDNAGISLREELARRLGKEKCYTVIYPEGCKDANDTLQKFGKEAVKELNTNRKEWPIEGVITMDEMYDTIADWYENGYPAGAKANIDGFDELLTFAPKQMTIITGIPTHGKDEFTNLILVNLASKNGWKIADCGFEEEAPQTVTKLVEKYTGKSFDFRVDTSHRISINEFERGIYFVDQHFYFYNTETIDCDIDSLISIAEILVKKYGINAVRFNPWNWIDANRPAGMSETEWVSVVLSKLIRFARKWGVHVFLIAHTTKMQKDKVSGKYIVPNLYDISGSAHFFNKTHNGITVYRDDETVDVYVQKVKQSWLGQKGFSTYRYNTFTRQYSFLSSSVKERPGARLIPMRDITEAKTSEFF
jgi:twinkle protein